MTTTDYRLAPLPDAFPGLDAAQAAALLEACRRPELRPLLRPGPPRLELLPTPGPPFCLTGEDRILFSAHTLTSPPLTAFCLRFALELRVWRAPCCDATPEDAAPLLWAAHGAACFLHLMVAEEQAICRALLPPALLHALDQLPLLATGAVENPVAIGEILALLRPMETPERPPPAPEALPALVRRWRDGAGVAKPLELLLTEGGDSRMRIDPTSGLSDYGCSPRPRPWAITFASSTASSISDLAFHHAEAARRSLIAHTLIAPPAEGMAVLSREVRQTLEQLLGLEQVPGCQVVLTSSGTDTELIALHLSACHPAPSEILNILVAPQETGSGVLLAAMGRHFLSSAPMEEHQEKGGEVRGFSAFQVTVKGVPVRDDDGLPIPPERLCAGLERLLEEAFAVGQHVLLHVVDSSKTGLGAPPLAWVLEQKTRHGDALDVVVDACQFRIDPAGVRAYLRHGCMVLVTGSKFFTGPPFSGALLVPPELSQRIVGHATPVPEGLSAYLSRHEWPTAWAHLAARLPERPNLGLLFRWQAALWEMEAFFQVPVADRVAILAAFGETIRSAMAADPIFEPVPMTLLERSALGVTCTWDGLQTIFTFRVRRPGPEGVLLPMVEEEVRRIYHLLNRDLTAMLAAPVTPREREVAARRCHIGQPVAVGKNSAGAVLGGLRISGGARLVYGVLHDPELGATRSARLEQELGDARLVLEKVAFIVRHWQALGGAIPSPSQGSGPLYQV